MTENEIIKALECCRDSERNGNWKECLRCPAGSRKWERCDASRNCIDDIMTKSIDLIKRQQADKQNLEIELKAMRGAANSYKAEIERLYIALEENQKTTKYWKDRENTARAEAIKEFAERLKEKAYAHERPFEANEDRFIKLVAVKDIDNLVVEMVGDQNA